MEKAFPLKRADLDHVGMTASLVCAVHCAVMPLAITLLPFIGLSFLANETTEWVLMGLSMLLGVTSICFGFRQHRRRRAFLFVSIGFALLGTGRVAETQEYEGLGIGLVVLGGLTVAGAHFVNRRLCHACRVCHPQTEGRGGSGTL